MNEQLIKGASRRYRIDDEWLKKYRRNSNKRRYVDIDEISKHPRQSQYLNDLVRMGKNINFDQESQKASFWLNGFAIGDDTDGIKVECVLLEDSNNNVHTRKYLAHVEHSVRIRRVYAENTTGLGLEFLGVGSKISNI